jgi:hypothetical protein
VLVSTLPCRRGGLWCSLCVRVGMRVELRCRRLEGASMFHGHPMASNDSEVEGGNGGLTWVLSGVCVLCMCAWCASLSNINVERGRRRWACRGLVRAVASAVVGCVCWLSRIVVAVVSLVRKRQRTPEVPSWISPRAGTLQSCSTSSFVSSRGCCASSRGSATSVAVGSSSSLRSSVV